MPRLIDADALQAEYKERHNGKRLLLIDVAPTIEPEPQWIPCSERLPEVNGDYLVTGRQGAVNKRKFEDGRWYGNWAVTAWMPLPAPYKEDIDD